MGIDNWHERSIMLHLFFQQILFSTVTSTCRLIQKSRSKSYTDRMDMHLFAQYIHMDSDTSTKGCLDETIHHNVTIILYIQTPLSECVLTRPYIILPANRAGRLDEILHHNDALIILFFLPFSKTHAFFFYFGSASPSAPCHCHISVVSAR